MLAVITGTPIEEPRAGRPGPDPLTLRLERALRRFRLQSAHNLLDEALASRTPAAFRTDVAWPVLRQLEAGLAAKRPLTVMGRAAAPVAAALGASQAGGSGAAVRVALLAQRESSSRCDEPSPTTPGS